MTRVKQISEIPGLEEFTGYTISEAGEVVSYRRYAEGKVLKPVVNKGGYHEVGLYGGGKQKRFLAHRLVMLAFNYIENHLEMTVNHIDEVKTNNNLSNLEWLTNADNIRYSNSGRNITGIPADDLAREFNAGDFASIKAFADKYEVNAQTMQGILREQATIELKQERLKCKTFTKAQKLEVARAKEVGEASTAKIAKEYGCSKASVHNWFNEFKKETGNV